MWKAYNMEQGTIMVDTAEAVSLGAEEDAAGKLKEDMAGVEMPAQDAEVEANTATLMSTVRTVSISASCWVHSIMKWIYLQT